ncbi:MAG: NAD(+)/NADH kinase [Pseudomonadota bacterium]|jgi:NAD+ kinase
MTKRVGLVIRPGNQKIVSCAEQLLAWCAARNIPVDAERQTAHILQLTEPGFSAKELVDRADPIVTLGGDGTLIGVARYVKGSSPVFVGVNFGNLGFLTEVPPDDVIQALDEALHGKVSCAERVLLHVVVERDGQSVFESQAVNDVVVQKGARSPLPELDLAVNGHDVARIRADGVIFATPTGSTAYSLAAGGSIAHPALSVILVTPICPHSLTNRPLILPGSARIELELPKFQDEVLVTIDGQVSEALKPGDRVKVSQAKQTVRFVISEDKSYFDILRTKLNWGVPNRPD